MVTTALRKIVTEDVVAERFTICSSCPKMKDEKLCESCGCDLGRLLMTPSASCPENKWGQVRSPDKIRAEPVRRKRRYHGARVIEATEKAYIELITAIENEFVFRGLSVTTKSEDEWIVFFY